MEITVAIPVFNRARMLWQALESCRQQTRKDFDIVISDNCSSENLLGVVAQFPDLKIRFHRHSTPVSPRDNFASAAALAEGKYLKFLCSDNLLFPETLRLMAEALENEPTAALAVGAYVEFYERNGGIEMKGGSPAASVRRGRLSNWVRLERTASWGFPATMFVAARFREVGGFHPSITAVFDWELSLALGGRHSVVTLDEPVCAVRLHAGQYTHELAFSQGARTLRDILILTSAKENSLHARFPLPPSQQRNLRQQVFWAALRNILSKPRKLKNFQRWVRELRSAGMVTQLLMGFPIWLCVRLAEKARIFRARREKVHAIDPASFLPWIERLVSTSLRTEERGLGR